MPSAAGRVSQPDLSRGSAGPPPRRALGLLLTLLLAAGLWSARPGGQPAAAQQAPALTGVLVTLSATADDLEAMASGGIVVRVVVDNRSEADLAGLQVRAPLPPRATLAAAWLGSEGTGFPDLDSGALRWGPLSLRRGEQSAAFTYRLVPAPGFDGAVIFRGVSVRPEVTWETGSPGVAITPALPLHGLWGERGLRRTVLPSGLTIFTRERPQSGTVAIRLSVRAGSRDENEVTRGGSHWLEHAHFLGTPRRPGNEEIFGAIQAVGGQINATTSWERTNYFNSVPAENFDLSLDVLSDQILNSTFPRDRFDRERRVVFEELRLRADNPAVRAFDEFFQLLFQVSPIRQGAGGTIESVSTIPIQTILAYRNERYVTGNTVVAAAGNLRHDEAVSKIAAAFAPLARGARSERPRAPEPVQTQPRRLEVGEGSRLAEIRLGWPAAADGNDEDAPALYILESILGTTGRRLQEGLLNRRIPVAAIAPAYAAFSDTGAFFVQARTQADAADATVAGIMAEIERARAGDIAVSDVQEAIRALIGSRALTGETSLGQTGVADLEVTDTLESFLEFVARLSRVTPGDVQRVAQKYLDPQNYTIVVVRP